MAQQPTTIEERRASRRFPMRIPVTLLSEGRTVAAFTRDVSAHGVFFFIPFTESALLDHDLDFIIEFPPEITLCNSLKVRCTGKVIRKHTVAQYKTGVAAQIFRYSFINETSQSQAH